MKPSSLHYAAMLSIAVAASVARGEPMEQVARVQKYSAAYVVNADGTSKATYERRIKILKQKALEMLKRANVDYSTSVERAEVVEAYTLKADGRRVEVPKSNYQLEINKGRDGDSPAYSDRTDLTVIFPDVAVNDVVVLKYTIEETQPMFAGQFSTAERFNRLTAYDEVAIRFDTPASLWTQYSTTAMTETRNEVVEGRKIVEWTWKNPDPVKGKRKDFSAYDPDKEPGYAFSTFRDYRQIAEAYGAVARPKAVTTERVRALANDLTKGIADPREQAKVLYEWVSTNIDYAGNCVGVGAVVPRDQSFVLDNKLGDCKDHATLLQAMLAAKGIASTQALVNSGSTYHLPKVPVISMVNHVILYVPSMDLFLDSTSSSTPFGMLPGGDSDKPVLLVDGYKADLRTPPIRGDGNRQSARTEVTVKPDGSVAGTIQVSSTGIFAVSGRDRLRNVSEADREELMERIYKGHHKNGFGRLKSDDPKPLLNSFHYDVQFETEEFAQLPGPGAFRVAPLYMTEAPLSMLAGMTEEEPEAEETACWGGTSVEDYIFHLPENMKIVAVPKGVTVSIGLATYKSSYLLEGSTLTVHRELVDRTARNICPVSVQRDFAQLAKKAAADLKAQVVYQ